MKKVLIMSLAVVASLLIGETMMAAVFGFVMITGYLTGCYLSEPARRVVECPVLAFRPGARKLEIPPST